MAVVPRWSPVTVGPVPPRAGARGRPPGRQLPAPLDPEPAGAGHQTQCTRTTDGHLLHGHLRGRPLRTAQSLIPIKGNAKGAREPPCRMARPVTGECTGGVNRNRRVRLGRRAGGGPAPPLGSGGGGRGMKLGLHYWNYSTPADPAAIAPTLAETATIAEEAGFSSFTVMDHYFQMEALAPADEPMLEGYTTLGFVAARTAADDARAAGHRRDVPLPGAARQDRDHAGRALRRPGPARHRRVLVRARAARPRRAGGAGGRAVRAAGGDAADLPADVERRQRPVRGQALPAGRDAVLPAAAAAGPTRRS